MGRSPALRRQVSASVRAAIKHKDISWKQLADETGIPRETLRRRLHDINPFTVDELESIALCLGLERDAFVNLNRLREAS
jgi:cyanate lyase